MSRTYCNNCKKRITICNTFTCKACCEPFCIFCYSIELHDCENKYKIVDEMNKEFKKKILSYKVTESKFNFKMT